MTMWIDHETAVELVGDERLGLLLHCHDEAWEKYDGVFRERLPLCDPVAMPTILRELIIEEARHAFSGVPGVVIRDPAIGGRFLLEIDRRLVIQFKKLTRDFLTVNNPTKTSLAFDRQELGADIPPFPRLTAGYQLGQYRTEVAGVWLAFVAGEECLWYHDLRTGEHNTMLEFPPPTGPSPADMERERKRWQEMNEKAEEEGEA